MADRKPPKGTLITGIIFVGSATLFVLSSLPLKIKPPDWVGHVFLLVLTASGIHLLDRYFLWREVFQAIEDALSRAMRKEFPLLEISGRLGIRRIYERRNAAVHEEVRTMVADAQRRIWLLGVSFSEKVGLAGLIDEIESQRRAAPEKPTPEVRILLLDALRSTGVYRTLLESPREVAQQIVDFNRPRSIDDPLFGQRLYRDFESACRLLTSCPDLHSSVRFYAHTPVCWMVVVDDTALFQPYTFGVAGGIHSPTNLCIGNSMPVLQFESETHPVPFDTLVSHFDRLWHTSDCDLLHIGARRIDQDRVIAEVFGTRSGWLRHVVGGLRRHDRRDPRRRCEMEQAVTVKWQHDGSEVLAPATVIDVSRRGLRLRFGEGKFPNVGVHLSFAEFPKARTRSAQYLIQHVVTACGGEFDVRWSSDGDVGVEARLPQRPNRAEGNNRLDEGR